MNGRVFASKILKEFIAEHPGTSLNEEQVIRIQKEFAKLRSWILKKVKNREKVNGAYWEIDGNITSDDEFMPNLSKNDGIAGPQTLREFPKEYEQMVRETIVHFNKLEGRDLNLTSVSMKKEKPTGGSYLSMNESDNK
ncbi:MAG: hypothetical protein JWL92_426 [Candidatus Nomurabacteria bacterium]|nr:hypothetical protein [Candidatus Nomurabacteria bacterium]